MNNSRSVNPAIRNFFLGSDTSDNQSVVSALSAGNQQNNEDDDVVEGIIAVVEPITNSDLNPPSNEETNATTIVESNQPSTERFEPTTNNDCEQTTTDVNGTTRNTDLNEPTTHTDDNVELNVVNNEMTLITQPPSNASENISGASENQSVTNSPEKMPPPPSRQLQNNSSTNNETTQTSPLAVQQTPPDVTDDNRKLPATQTQTATSDFENQSEIERSVMESVNSLLASDDPVLYQEASLPTDSQETFSPLNIRFGEGNDNDSEDSVNLMTNFIDRTENQAVCLSILSEARALGYAKTMTRGKRKKNLNKIIRGGMQLVDVCLECQKILNNYYEKNSMQLRCILKGYIMHDRMLVVTDYWMNIDRLL